MAPPSNRPSRPRPAGSRPGAGGPRQAGPVSRPWRHLLVLAALIIAMFATVIGGTLVHPSEWHTKFKVQLGLDLHGGTLITLKAVSGKGHVPTKAALNQAIGILTSRFNALGVSSISIQQQGSQYITVSIPGKSAKQISPLLTAAVLEFRQVLLCTTEFPGSPSVYPGPQCETSKGGPRAVAGLPSTAPTVPPVVPSPSPSASGSPSPSPSASPSASKSGAGTQAIGARMLAASSPSPSPSASASTSPKASSSPSPSGSASPSPSPSASPSPKPTLYLTGDQAAVKPHTLALFKKLDCTNKDWQKAIYGNQSNSWNDPKSQIVACGGGMKYVLGPAIVSGKELTHESSGVLQTGQVVVNFALNGQGTTAFGKKTVAMNEAYWSSSDGGFQTSVLNQFAIVLDGKIVEAPTVQQAITNGQGQISGNFTQKSAADLANTLRYGQLPVSFSSQSSDSVSAQLGAAQLDAGLIAAAIGLFLVVLYSVAYYRGLAVVSVFSLASSALLTWLSVILLGKFVGYALTLAGVAGLIVAIGITADSFVVFFERLRDEVREGRSLRAAVERGWERARRTILVSDTVSFLAALLLYIFAIGDVRGFAFTLGLTTLIDIVVVFLFTKPMVTLLARTEFFGRGHKWSGLDPSRLGARSPWRGSRAAAPRPVTGGAATAGPARTTPKEA